MVQVIYKITFQLTFWYSFSNLIFTTVNLKQLGYLAYYCFTYITCMYGLNIAVNIMPGVKTPFVGHH